MAYNGNDSNPNEILWRTTEILIKFVAYTIAVFHHSSLPTTYRTNHSTSSFGIEGSKYFVDDGEGEEEHDDERLGGPKLSV